MMAETLLQRIMRHEGSETKNGSHICFKDSRGKNTLGYGTLIDFPGGITEVEARYLLQNRILIAGVEAKADYPGFLNLDLLRQGIIVELVFWIGFAGLMEFKVMNAAIAKSDWTAAAAALIDSALHEEAASRAEELARLLAVGTVDTSSN